MSGVNGLDDLKRFAKRLKKLGEPGFREKLARNLAKESIELTREGFAKGADPYGHAWAPLKSNRARENKANAKIAKSNAKFHSSGASGPQRGKTTSKPLMSSRILANSIHVQEVSANGFRIGTGVVYAAVHNFGHQFAPRQQAAIRVGKGQIMFVKNDDSWSWELARTKWKRILKKAGFNAKKGAMLPLSIGEVSRVFKVTVAPKIPKRQFLPSKGKLPNTWHDAFQETFDEAVKKLLD